MNSTNRIITMITETVKKYPSRTALTDMADGSSLTLGEADLLARRIAARLD